MRRITRLSTLVATCGALATVAGCEAIFGLKRAELYIVDGSGGGSSTTSTTTSSTGTGTGGGTGGTGGGGGGVVGGVEAWGEGFPDSIGADLGPNPTGIAVDAKGNTIVTGSYVGTLTLAPGAGGTFTSVGPRSYFVASFDAGGAYRWGASFNAIGNQGVSVHASVAVDSDGNAFWAADLSKASVQVGSSTYTNPAVGSDAILVASFDPMGAVRWATVYGTTVSSFPTAVGMDPSGNVVVAGAFTGSLTFGALSAITSTGASQNMFLAKLGGAKGVPAWANGYGDATGQPTGDQVPFGMAVDQSGAILVTGKFDVSAQFGTTPLFSAGGSDIFVAKFNGSGGSALWSVRYGSPKDDSGTAVALDPGGTIFVTGTLGGTADLGGGNMMATPAMSGADGFLARYDGTAANKLLWGKVFGGTPGITFGQSGLAGDSSGDVIVAGATLGPVDFGGGAKAPAGANPNVYLAKLDASAKHLWSKLFGDANGQVSAVVATDPTTQDVVVAFGNNGTVNLGTTTVSAKPTQCALVVARYHP